MRPRLALHWTALLAIAVAIDATPAGAGPRLVVKYRSQADCAGCLLERGATSNAAEASLAATAARLAIRSSRPWIARDGAGSTRTASERLDAARERFAARAARAGADAHLPDLDAIHVVEIADGLDPERAAAELAESPLVEWAHPDREMRVDVLPNDPLLAQQWGALRIAAPVAWDTAAGTGTIIAIVDTGIDATHPDVAANLWSNPGEVAGNGIDDDGNGKVDDVVGWDFVRGDAVPEDRHGHGTHVAGIAAATAGNAAGIAGIAFGARVMALKGIGDAGIGWESDLAAAILYAAESGADVINNSWGGPGPSPLMTATVAAARALGAVVVAAAGNEAGSAKHRQPAGVAGVIAVGASTESDTIASFSNSGDVLSVAAPGTNVLSLRAAGATGLGPGSGGAGYQALSGTSMAAPHAAGLAAVVLSALPGLHVDEVQWQLELNAHQPGHPGWEGEPWNPYFGWGRIDGTRVFDPVPVTTRLAAPSNAFHAIAGSVTPGLAQLGVRFTTVDPVAWSASVPPWLVATPAAGGGDAQVSLDFDATALAPGTVGGTIAIDAPGAADGGGAASITAHVHRDERLGVPTTIATDVPWIRTRPAVASDGVGSVVVWNDDSVPALLFAHVDGAGAVGPTTALASGWPPKWEPQIAFDGRSYLVVWFEPLELPSGWIGSIKGARISADGTALDASGFTIAERKSGLFDIYRDPRVAFDGTAHTVVWEDFRGLRGETRVHARRVGADGSLRGRRAIQLYPDKSDREPQYVEPAIGCAAGRCLVAWSEFDGEVAPPDQHYVDKGYGVVLVHGTPVSTIATRLIDDVQVVLGIASDGTDFLLSGYTIAWCASAGKRQDVAIAARVTAAGTPLDLEPIRLDRTTDDCPQAFALQGAFDGENWVVPFQVLAAKPPDLQSAYHVFGARLSPSGELLDDEVQGLLLHDEPRVYYSGLAATRLSSIVAWTERDLAFRDTLRTRRVLPRATSPGYPVATIGAIGTLATAEGEDLLRTIAPPAGFDPATTTLSASGLPPGAVFDPPTGALRWRPDGTEAGVHAGLTFTATSGAQSAAETVAIVVGEAQRSLRGRVRRASGLPVTDVGVQIAGIPGEKPIAFTDRDGRFRLTDLPPRVYSAKLDGASRKRYRVLSKTSRVVLGAGDTVVPDIVVEPK